MKQINLLESQEQETVKLEIIFLTIRSMLSLIVLISSLVAILFSISNMILKSERIESLVNSTLVQRNNNLGSELNNLSSLLTVTEKVQKDYWSVRRTVIEITQLIPPGNTLYSLAIDKTTNNVELTGFSLRRDDLLKLQKNLENSKLFTEINSPLANLLKKENINFQFQAVLK